MEHKFAYVVMLLGFVFIIGPIAVLNWRFWTRVSRPGYDPNRDPEAIEAVDAIKRPSLGFLAFLLFPCLVLVAVSALLILEAMHTGIVGSAHCSRAADPVQYWLHLV
jgi:hypothetical protein